MNRQMGFLSMPGTQKGGPGWVFVDFASENLPIGLDQRTIVFATDLHINRFWTDEALDNLIRQIGGMSPDLILWGGDYAESEYHAKRFFQAASALTPPLGMFGVVGNNDYECFQGKMGEFVKLSKQSGIFPLINKTSVRDVGGGRMIVSGVDEPKHGNPGSRMLRGQVRPGDFRLLISHAPHAIDAAVAGIGKKPDIALCGHTHGGQYALFRLTPYTIGFERKRHKDSRFFFVSGSREFDGMRMIVSRGVGTSTLPFRVGARPELHLIKLFQRLQNA